MTTARGPRAEALVKHAQQLALRSQSGHIPTVDESVQLDVLMAGAVMEEQGAALGHGHALCVWSQRALTVGLARAAVVKASDEAAQLDAGAAAVEAARVYLQFMRTARTSGAFSAFEKEISEETAWTQRDLGDFKAKVSELERAVGASARTSSAMASQTQALCATDGPCSPSPSSDDTDPVKLLQDTLSAQRALWLRLKFSVSEPQLEAIADRWAARLELGKRALSQ